ncbi:MAG: PriCT-2 domain-containing protein [Proteobacteria bacterium]|nr:PriCT-2 domain-containing protein [Pseudomonadota bacterium]
MSINTFAPQSACPKFFIIYSRSGIGHVEYYQNIVTEDVLRDFAAQPRVSPRKDGPVACCADLDGKPGVVFVEDGTIFGRREDRIVARRLNKNVKSITALVYDVENNRQKMPDLLDKLETAGVKALVTTTHSHNPAGVTFIRVKAVEGFYGRRLDDVSQAEIIAFATNKEMKGGGGLKADLSTIAIVSRDRMLGDEVCIELKHEPLYRYRIIIFLSSPFGADGVTNWQHMDAQQRSIRWRRAYLGYAQELEIEIDPACSDLPHASYLPSVHPDRRHTYEWRYVDGAALDPAKLLLIAATAEVLEEKRREAFSARNLNPGAGLDEIRAALNVIPASCDYREWRTIIWAVKSAFEETDLEDEARDLIEAWSQTDPQLYSAAAFDRVWADGRAGISGGVTMGSFWHIAREYGFDRAVFDRLSILSNLI